MKNSQPKTLGQNSLCYPASPARRGRNAAHASINLDKTSTYQIVTRSPLDDGRCLSRPPARSSSRNGPTHHRRPELSHEAHPDHLWGVADDGAFCIRNAASYFVADTLDNADVVLCWRKLIVSKPSSSNRFLRSGCIVFLFRRCVPTQTPRLRVTSIWRSGTRQ